MTELSDMLNAAKGDRSVDLFISDAQKRGVSLNPTARSAVYKALQGKHAKNPDEKTLQLLADVFGLDIREVRKAAKKPPGELGPWKPTSESARLDQQQRNALDQLIKSIVRTVPAATTPTPPKTEQQVRIETAVTAVKGPLKGAKPKQPVKKKTGTNDPKP